MKKKVVFHNRTEVGIDSYLDPNLVVSGNPAWREYYYDDPLSSSIKIYRSDDRDTPRETNKADFKKMLSKKLASGFNVVLAGDRDTHSKIVKGDLSMGYWAKARHIIDIDNGCISGSAIDPVRSFAIVSEMICFFIKNEGGWDLTSISGYHVKQIESTRHDVYFIGRHFHGTDYRVYHFDSHVEMIKEVASLLSEGLSL